MPTPLGWDRLPRTGWDWDGHMRVFTAHSSAGQWFSLYLPGTYDAFQKHRALGPAAEKPHLSTLSPMHVPASSQVIVVGHQLQLIPELGTGPAWEAI